MTQTGQGLGHVAPHSSGEDLKRELKEVNATPGPSPSNLNKEDLKRELKVIKPLSTATWNCLARSRGSQKRIEGMNILSWNSLSALSK